MHIGSKQIGKYVHEMRRSFAPGVAARYDNHGET